MTNSLKKSGLYFLIFLVCLLVHFLIMQFVIQSSADFLPIYIFTGIVSLVTLIAIGEANEFFHKSLGFIFIGIIALKLIAAKVFMNSLEEIDEPIYKYSFVFLYLISLVLITVYTAKLLLNPKNDKKQKIRFYNSKN